MTKEFIMEIGGKQGSKLTGRMFGELMDILAEEINESGEGFKLTPDLTIGILLWVDDVVSCVDGAEDQEAILQKIDTFAKNHKLEWGQEKSKIMQVGKHEKNENIWKVGEMEIAKCTTYTYLGDVITQDGKNTENIENRKNKLRNTTASINSIAASEILSTIETPVILELHEKVNVAKLLTNAESWNLLKGEQNALDKIEIQSIKNLFDLPL